MYNVLLGLLAGVLIFVPFYLWLQVWWQALPPALIAAIGAYFYLSRVIWKRLESLIQEAFKVLEPLSTRPELAQHRDKRNAMVEESIKKLKEGYTYSRWQFMVKAQVEGQIGVVLYSIKQEMNEALPYLEKSFKRNWIAQAMLAVIYMKKHKPEKMEEIFEMAVRLNKKQDLLWNLYAYCLQKIKKREKAIEVLGRALKILPSNKNLIDNLVALQNNKKMKMKAYGEQWYQFHLEKPQQQKVKQMSFSRRPR